MPRLSVIGMAAAVGGMGALAFQAFATPAPAVTLRSEITAATAKVAPLEYEEAHFQAVLAMLDTQPYSVRPLERDQHQGVAPTSKIKTDRMTVRQMPKVASTDMPHVTYQVALMDMASSSHPTQVESMDRASITYKVESMDMPHATYQVALMDMPSHVTQVSSMDMPNATYQVALMDMPSHLVQKVANRDLSQQAAGVQRVLDRLQ